MTFNKWWKENEDEIRGLFSSVWDAGWDAAVDKMGETPEEEIEGIEEELPGWVDWRETFPDIISYLGTNPSCVWLKADDSIELAKIFYDIYRDYGLITEILEASSSSFLSGCNHYGDSHTNGRGIDPRYYVKDGKVWMEPTHYLISQVRKKWPGSQVVVDNMLKEELKAYSGTLMRGVAGSNKDDHLFKKDNSRSHLHIGLNGSKIVT